MAFDWLKAFASNVFGSTPEEGTRFDVGGDAAISTDSHVHTVEIKVPEVGSVTSRTQFGGSSVTVGGSGSSSRDRAGAASGSGGRTP